MIAEVYWDGERIEQIQWGSTGFLRDRYLENWPNPESIHCPSCGGSDFLVDLSLGEPDAPETRLKCKGCNAQLAVVMDDGSMCVTIHL